MIRVIHIGLGEIGGRVVNALAQRPKHATLVAVVDANPSLHGKKLRDVLRGSPRMAQVDTHSAGHSTPPVEPQLPVPNLTVTSTLGAALESLKGGKPDVAIVTTGSTTEAIAPTLRALADAGIHAVTSCEEFALPSLRSGKLGAQLDAYAAKKGVVFLGTGINPGYAMDAFALACTAPCLLVRGIKVIRSLDASKRRYQLQKKVAAGMEVAEVRKLIRAGKIGHVGLKESVAMIARGLGWKLDRIDEKFEPILADHLFFNEHFRVQPGQVRGLWMRGFGRVGKKTLIELDLTMAFDVDSFDEVIIDGDPPLLVRTKSGFPGDACTVAMLLNCADSVADLKPGVRTMLDMVRVHSVGV